MTRSSQAGATLMSLEDSLAQARPLLHWSDAQLDEVAQRVAGAAALWAARWTTGAASAPLRARPADESPGLRARTWVACREAAVDGPWWSADADTRGALRDALFGAPPAAAIARDGAMVADEASGDAWDDFLAVIDSLCEAHAESAVPMAEVVAAAFRAWSGAVAVELEWFGAGLHLLFSAEAVRRMLRTQRAPHGRRLVGAPPASPLAAVAASRVHLRVQLESFELELGSLVGLQPGDVLRTRHPLDRPALLLAADAPADGTPLCLGWLGRRDEHLAVELHRLPASAPR